MIYDDQLRRGRKVDKKEENLLYIKISGCFDDLKLTIEAFKDFLHESCPPQDPLYYKARNYLRLAEKLNEEAVQEAKRLLGPVEAYEAADFEAWRADFLQQHKILAESEDLNGLKEELGQDEFLKQWISSDDIGRLLAKDYEPQMRGKRKLCNIKVRIVLDRLAELLGEAQKLKKQAQDKFQSGA
jgi:hypothetical protein